MSKRYGRNQKRKHKQQLAELQKDLSIKTSENIYAKSLNARNTHAIRLMSNILNKEFPLLTPKTKYMEHIHDYISVASTPDINFSVDPLALSNLSYVIEQLPAIQVSAERNKVTNLRHFYIQTGHKNLGYTVSPEFLEMVSEEDAVDFLAERIAPMILNALRTL